MFLVLDNPQHIAKPLPTVPFDLFKIDGEPKTNLVCLFLHPVDVEGMSRVPINANASNYFVIIARGTHQPD